MSGRMFTLTAIIRVFSFFVKFMPLDILNQQNAKVFQAKSWIFFKKKIVKISLKK